MATMSVDQAVRVVQAAYPRIYLACHTRHQRARSTAHRLSARDAAILAHLDEQRSIASAELARHMSVGRPTMSEALKRLRALGFVERVTGSAAVVLTPNGSRAIRETSVLEVARLIAILSRVSARDRLLICRGLERFVRACRETNATPIAEAEGV